MGNTFVWVIYHLSFMILLIIEKFNNNNDNYNETISQATIIFGFIIVFSILAGASIDII